MKFLLTHWMTLEVILSPIQWVVYHGAAAPFPVSGKTMFLVLSKENFIIICAMLVGERIAKFNGKRRDGHTDFTRGA